MNFQNLVQKFVILVNHYFLFLEPNCKIDFETTSEQLLLLTNLNEDYGGSAYFNYLSTILSLDQVQQFPFNSNSLLFIAKTPQILKIYPQVKEEIIIKTPKYICQEEEQLKYQKVQTDRELEINEDLSNFHNFAVIVAYFRIQDTIYFIYPKYPLTLADFFKTAEPCHFQKLLFKFAYQFARALQKLHSCQIIHRDVKPQNIFLTSLDCEKVNLKIADFDRSRKINDFSEQIQQQDITAYSSTFDYDPPEAGTTNYNFSSDIWQFGLTCKQMIIVVFQMANNGIYPLPRQSLVLLEEDYNKLTVEFIQQTLSSKNIDDRFVRLIASCLEKELQNRITLSKFLENLKIIRIDNTEIDTVIGADDDSFYEQSTGHFDNTINWRRFQLKLMRKQSLTKSPSWRSPELNQPQGDIFQFD